jgi:hypothetical protein
MVFRKGLARCVGRGPDGAAGLFGEADRFPPAAGIGDAGADHQRRALGRVEHRRQPLDAGRGRHGAQRQVGQRRHLALAVPVVDGNRDVARPHRRGQRGDEGADQRQRHILGAGGLDRILDIGPGEFGRALVVEERVVREDRAGLLPRGDDHRRVVAERGEQVAQRMPGARGAVQVYQRRLAGSARVTVGHGDDDRLVQPHHIGEGQRAQHRDLGAARVAEQAIDPEVLEDGEGSFTNGGHGRITSI